MSGERSLDDELAIDRACVAFEDAFRSGEGPEVDAFADALPGALREDARAELRALEAELLASERATARLEGPPAAPTRVGRYQVVGRLGQGGMGTVHEAVQDQPRRRVALKVIRTDRLGAREVRRFRREAGVLAHLHHPCIAQVYEAGTARAQDGGAELPYLAMELVDGPSIVAHARARSLDVRARLTLLVRVADAVQHAHDQGVVHRDLKPANILVRVGSSSAGSGADGGLGRPVVLDFGLARAEGLGGAESLETEAGQIVGTLSHMAPEQVAGALPRPGAGVDGRADVYALGVVMYELLGGRLPLELSGRSFAEAVEAIRSEEPERLGALDARLRGDVEIVCGKALMKDPARRYASPAELGADLQRILDDEPIRARPPSAVYHLRKFARRNPFFVGSLAAAGLMLLVALGLVSYYAVREGDLRREAEVERDKVAAVRAFQDEILGGANLEQGGRPRETTLLDAVRAAAVGIDNAFPGAPDVEIAARRQLGHVFLSLSELEEARVHFEWAHALGMEAHGRLHEDTFGALLGLARVAAADQRYDEARELSERTVALARELFGDLHRNTLNALNNRATLLEAVGEYDEALSLHREVLAARGELFG
ncbi:MAG: serine/threonine-protein kinase, partial [Planctomycetota bacterium]